METADTAWKRAVGLLGRSRLEPDGGLWISPCNGVHTYFMRFPIDVVFLDREHRVLRLASNVPPWRFRGPVLGARVVIELPAGAIHEKSLQLGKRYTLDGR